MTWLKNSIPENQPELSKRHPFLYTKSQENERYELSEKKKSTSHKTVAQGYFRIERDEEKLPPYSGAGCRGLGKFPSRKTK